MIDRLVDVLQRLYPAFETFTKSIEEYALQLREKHHKNRQELSQQKISEGDSQLIEQEQKRSITAPTMSVKTDIPRGILSRISGYTPEGNITRSLGKLPYTPYHSLTDLYNMGQNGLSSYSGLSNKIWGTLQKNWPRLSLMNNKSILMQTNFSGDLYTFAANTHLNTAMNQAKKIPWYAPKQFIKGQLIDVSTANFLLGRYNPTYTSSIHAPAYYAKNVTDTFSKFGLKMPPEVGLNTANTATEMQNTAWLNNTAMNKKITTSLVGDILTDKTASYWSKMERPKSKAIMDTYWQMYKSGHDFINRGYDFDTFGNPIPVYSGRLDRFGR